MPHRVVRRERALVGVENGKGNVEAPGGDPPAEVVDARVVVVAGFAVFAVAPCQPRDRRFDEVLSDRPVQLGTRPFDLDVHDAVQNAVGFFHYHRELVVCEFVCVCV